MRTALAILTCFFSLSAEAQMELTPFVATQGGGTIRVDSASGDLDRTAAWGAFLTFDRGSGRKLDLIVSRQNTGADVEDAVLGTRRVDMNITYLQLGGRYFVTDPARVAAYIAATVGASWFEVEGGDAIRPSGSAGGGVDIALSERIALRLDGRFLVTLVRSDGEIACAGPTNFNCVAFAEGSQLTQFAASAGIVFHF